LHQVRKRQKGRGPQSYKLGDRRRKGSIGISVIGRFKRAPRTTIPEGDTQLEVGRKRMKEN